MAFALSIPTIGFYTFATFTNYLGSTGSGPSIMIRAATLIIICVAFFSYRGRILVLPVALMPGLFFVTVFLLRMVENAWVQGIPIPPSTSLAFLNFTLGAIVSSLLLSFLWNGLNEQDGRIIFSTMCFLFVIGVVLNLDKLGTGRTPSRLSFEKVNPISLAYVCSSFFFYYLIVGQRSKVAAIEALVIVPFLFFVAAQARSRGMMISTSACLVLYLIFLPGKRRIRLSVALFTATAASALLVEKKHFQVAIDALMRIDTTDDLSTAMRVQSFSGALEQFYRNPWFGRYVNELSTGYYPHNVYLEALMSVGALGASLFFLHIFFSLWAAAAIIRNPGANWIWVFVALMTFRSAIGSAASGSIWGNSELWISSFLSISIWTGMKRNRERHIPRRPFHSTPTNYGSRSTKNVSTSSDNGSAF